MLLYLPLLLLGLVSLAANCRVYISVLCTALVQKVFQPNVCNSLLYYRKVIHRFAVYVCHLTELMNIGHTRVPLRPSLCLESSR